MSWRTYGTLLYISIAEQPSFVSRLLILLSKHNIISIKPRRKSSGKSRNWKEKYWLRRQHTIRFINQNLFPYGTYHWNLSRLSDFCITHPSSEPFITDLSKRSLSTE